MIPAKMRKRGSIVSKLVAKMIVNAGFSHVITMDLHQKEIQGFFDCPVDNLRASPFLLQYIQDCVSWIFYARYLHTYFFPVLRFKPTLESAAKLLARLN